MINNNYTKLVALAAVVAAVAAASVCAVDARTAVNLPQGGPMMATRTCNEEVLSATAMVELSATDRRRHRLSKKLPYIKHEHAGGEDVQPEQQQQQQSQPRKGSFESGTKPLTVCAQHACPMDGAVCCAFGNFCCPSGFECQEAGMTMDDGKRPCCVRTTPCGKDGKRERRLATPADQPATMHDQKMREKQLDKEDEKKEEEWDRKHPQEGSDGSSGGDQSQSQGGESSEDDEDSDDQKTLIDDKAASASEDTGGSGGDSAADGESSEDKRHESAETLMSRDILERTNAYRKSVDSTMPHLHHDEHVAQLAMEHAKNIADEKYELGHTGFMQRVKRLKFESSHSGENVGEVINMEHPVHEVMAAWKNSPSHRANLVYPNYNVLGVATVKAKAGHWIFVQMFAHKDKN